LSADPKIVLCIKWGTKYAADYVNRLYGMVSRNLSPPFRFICFTDDPTGIRSEVEIYPLPELGCEPPAKGPGAWRKTGLWGHTLFNLTGVALFLDLDVVITRPIDELFTYGSQDDVILARNWIRPLERLGQSSVFRYPIGKHGYMLDSFRRDPLGTQAKYSYEQRYVTNGIQGGVKFFPSQWIVHFRLNCLGPWFVRYLRRATVPEATKIVMFAGGPRPGDALLGRWTSKDPILSRAEHLWRLFNGNRRESFGRHLKHYLKPVPWVAEYWRE